MVGRCRVEQEEIRPVHEIDVVVGVPAFEDIAQDGTAGEALEGGLADEVTGAFAHDDLNLCTRVDQKRGQCGGLEGGDGARDLERDPRFKF